MELRTLLLNCNTIENTLDCLYELIEGVNSRKKISFSRGIVKVAQEVVSPFFYDHPVFIPKREPGEAFILDSKDGLKFITSLSLCRTEPKPEPMKATIFYIIDILEKLIEPKSSILTQNQVSNLISQAQRIRAIELINRWRPLFVVLINKSDKELNSFYMPNVNTAVATAPHPNKGNTEYIFLHEIGHSLQAALTKNMDKVPKSFLPIFEVTFHNQRTEVDPEDWPEIFADSFTIAVSCDTPLRATNPFCQEFDKDSIAGLTAYFKLLVRDTLDKDLSKPADMDWTQEKINIVETAMSKAMA